MLLFFQGDPLLLLALLMLLHLSRWSYSSFNLLMLPLFQDDPFPLLTFLMLLHLSRWSYSISSLLMLHMFLAFIAQYRFTSKSKWILCCDFSHVSLIVVEDQLESNCALARLLVDFCVVRIDATTTYVAFLACFSSYSFHLSFLILSATTLSNFFAP